MKCARCSRPIQVAVKRITEVRDHQVTFYYCGEVCARTHDRWMKAREKRVDSDKGWMDMSPSAWGPSNWWCGNVRYENDRTEA